MTLQRGRHLHTRGARGDGAGRRAAAAAAGAAGRRWQGHCVAIPPNIRVRVEPFRPTSTSVWCHSTQKSRQCGARPSAPLPALSQCIGTRSLIVLLTRRITCCSASVRRYTLASFIITSASACTASTEAKHAQYRALVDGVYVEVVLAVSPPAAAAAAATGGAGAPAAGPPATSWNAV
jgi:hypothetical protein